MMLLAFLLACASEPAPPAAAPAATPPAASPAAPPPAAAYQTVDLAAFKAAVNAGRAPHIIDVRTPTEYTGGHVPGAKNIPLNELEARVAELSSMKDQDLYLICESGGRSARAADVLAKQGFKAINVAGGTYAWRNAGYPVEQ